MPIMLCYLTVNRYLLVFFVFFCLVGRFFSLCSIALFHFRFSFLFFFVFSPFVFVCNKVRPDTMPSVYGVHCTRENWIPILDRIVRKFFSFVSHIVFMIMFNVQCSMLKAYIVLVHGTQLVYRRFEYHTCEYHNIGIMC